MAGGVRGGQEGGEEEHGQQVVLQEGGSAKKGAKGVGEGQGVRADEE